MTTHVVRVAALVAALAAAAPAAAQGPGPRSPQESLEAFDVVAGHVVELVAAEPLVFDPVAIAWDDDGRAVVAEMGDYPKAEGGGRIVFLLDRDGDGSMDERQVFASGLPFPSGVLPWRGGVLVTAAPDILWLADRDGDGVADTHEVILTGFTPGNQQLRVNGLVAGPDGWIWAANGRSGGTITSPKRPDAAPVSIDRHDLRFRPETGEVEAVAGFSQFGLAFDAGGERYSNWNTAPIRHVVFPLDVALRHPYAAPDADMEVLEEPSTHNRVFPASAAPTTFNREPTDAFNASCGLSIDRRACLDPPGCAYVCEPLLNVVHRRELVPAGVSFVARRPAGESSREFLASRDPWFRPVFTAFGPDGALWICDFYRRFVEHPDFVRAELRDGIAWDEGKDRGRIWRVRPIAPPAERLLAGNEAGGRRRARRTLAAAGGDVARVALNLAGQADAAARFEATLAAEPLDAESRAAVLARALVTAPADRWVERAAVCVAEDAAPLVIERLLDADAPGGGEAPAAVLGRLAEVCGRLDADGRESALGAVVAGAGRDAPGTLALVAGWLRGRRMVGVLDVPAIFGGRSFDAWMALARDNAASQETHDALGDTIELLALDRSPEALGILLGRLATPLDIEGTTAVLRALRGREPSAVAEGIVAAWPSASPGVRRRLFAELVRAEGLPERLPHLLAALERGDVAPGDIDPEARHALLAEATLDEASRERLAALLGAAASADRRAVVAAVAAALPERGDGRRGGDLFTKHCAGCHRSGDTGARVGPDLVAMHAKPTEVILEDILDPNLRLTGEYAAVTVVTKDGEAITGLVAGESPLAVRLNRPEGTVTTIPRASIESLRGTGRSLMPEGFETALSPADLADLIRFLRHGR